MLARIRSPESQSFRVGAGAVGTRGRDACVALWGHSTRLANRERAKKEAANIPDCFPLVRSDSQLRMRSAGIGSNSTAGGTEEPWEIRGAILCVTPEIVSGGSTNIIAESEIATRSRT